MCPRKADDSNVWAHIRASTWIIGGSRPLVEANLDGMTSKDRILSLEDEDDWVDIYVNM